jgi:uncharacterized protein (DUF362 family)
VSPSEAHNGADFGGWAPAVLTRRKLLASAGLAAAGAWGARAAYRRWEGFQSADVFIGRAASYTSGLRNVLLEGLRAIGVDRKSIAGKSVLLKPNLVEPSRDAPHINTHPAFIVAAAEAFRSLDAREVFVGEGPGHCRDTHLVLDESGVGDALREHGLEFVDLNIDDVDPWRNRSRLTRLAELHLPRSLRRADVVVSLPKMKTHHWTGATLSMKNFFGVMPGVCYGWPKNVLHHHGIHESVVDAVSTVRPHLAIVDGVVAMEGDGPIMGSPKAAGLVVMGTNLPAVDATCCRLMRIAPERIGYLAAASGRLGPIRERNIGQRGETIASCAQTFKLVDHPEIARLRG